MSCGIRRIVNGCAAHQVVARRDVSEHRTHPPSPKSPSKGSARSGVHARAKMWISVLGWTWRDSRKNKLYYAFRELGRVVRTIFLLEYISNDELRQIIQSAQNKCEGFNLFAQWAYFGADKIEENVRENQLKIIKYNHLIANLLIFHNCHTMTKALKELEAEVMKLTPELLSGFSPYCTHHANRFGMYELRDRNHELIYYNVTFQMDPVS